MLKREDDVLGIDGHPKSAGTNLWVSLADIGCDVKCKTEGPNLRRSLEWLYEQLASPDLINKEMAMLLLCRVKYVYTRFDVMKKPTVEVIEKQVLSLLSSEVMLVKARAIEVF